MYWEAPCTLHPLSPVVTSFITIIQYQNQEIDNDTIHRSYWGFTSFICIHLCVSVQFFVHAFLKYVNGFVLHVAIYLPFLFTGFTRAPVCTASSLFLFLKRIPHCTSSTCNVPVCQQWTLSQLLASHIHRQYCDEYPHPIYLRHSNIYAGGRLLEHLSAWLCKMSAYIHMPTGVT